MAKNPFDQLDTPANPFDQLDTPAAGSGFKSGQEFKDTRDTMSKLADLWKQAKDEFHNSKSLSELQEEYKNASPEVRAQMDAKLDADVGHARSAGSAVLDMAGSLPAMVAGAVMGVGSGAGHMDASKGLQTADEVMGKMMPSSLLGHADAQKDISYQAPMLPFTALMDTLNSVPELAGDTINKAGYPKAAQQVSDGGKLAIMAGMAGLGAHEVYKGMGAKGAEPLKIADPREEPTKVAPANVFDKFDNNIPAFDRGVPGDRPGVQGELWSQEHDTPTQPIPNEAQGELFGQPPAPEGTINYEKTFPFDLVPKDEPPPPTQMGLNMPEHDSTIDLQGDSNFAKLGENTWDAGQVGSRDAARAKAAEQAASDAAAKAQADAVAAKKANDMQAAQEAAERQKQADYAKMEAQRELDHMNTVNDVANTPGRNFFTDPLSRDKVTPKDERLPSTAREFFLDPANRDKLDLHDITDDHGFAKDTLGDKSLMDHAPTQTMVDALRNGDVHGALDAISKFHDNVNYRNLADYLKTAIDNVKVRLHDDGVLQMGDRQATGYYDPESHTVGLSKVGAVSPHTVLHELVHSLTSHFVNERPNDLRVMGLKDLYNKLGDMGMQKEFPNVRNVKECLAEAFSNPEFQDYLKEHKLADRSTWRRFVDNVKAMMGFSSSTRIGVSTALEHVLDLGKQVMDAKGDNQTTLKDAGVPGKLADLMVTREPAKPNMVVNNENMKAAKFLGKIAEQFDFTPLKPEQIIQMAKDATDIPKGALETLKANLDAGGRMASLRYNNNPVVKYTFAHIDQAVKNYEKYIKDNITDTKLGIKSMLRGLSKEEFTTVHQQLMLDEGVTERTPQQMRELGWSEKMIQTAQRIREVDNDILNKVNEARASLNPPLPPIEKRMGHLAGRFLGDFYHTVYELNPDGTRKRAVMMVTDSTSRGAQHLADYIKEQHPEWDIDTQKYNDIKKGNNSDRFSGFMELMSFIGKKDPEVAKAINTLDMYNRRAATNYLNNLRHAKDKVRQPGGVIGSEGNKTHTGNFFGDGVSKVDVMKNAEEGFKGHLAYIDTSAKWVEMQKAMANISKVITDEGVTKQMPNAVRWSTAYTDHALHRNQGYLTDMAQSLLSHVGEVTGIGHTNLTKGINSASTFEMRNWMGIGNIPFALKHMMLPFQKMPAMMAYMHSVGGIDPIRQSMAGLKSLSSYYHYLKGEATTPFEAKAFQYAKDNNVFNVNLDNLSGRIQAGKTRQALGKFADADFSGPEHAIRGNSFFFYAHLLHDAGMAPETAMNAAEHLSKFLYTDYAPHEAPRGAAKGGWIGQLALQVTRYKANELSQLNFFHQHGAGEDAGFMKKFVGNAPLMTHIGAALAFTGVTGMLGFKEMDEIYSLFRKQVMASPDNLTALLQRSKAPELVKHGLFAKIGIDSKISEADLLPSPFPTTKAEISQLGTLGNAIRFHDEFHTKQLALSLTPSTFRGYAENKMFTQPPATSGPNAGKSLYLNPNTGEGRVWRTPEQQTLRNIGFHSIAETNETDNNYATKRIEQDHADLADHILDKAKSHMASGSLDHATVQALAQEYAKHQQDGQPAFASALVSYAEKQHLSQLQQMQLKAALNRGIPNSLNIIQRNK